MKKKIEQKVEELALPIVTKEGLELVDVEYTKEGSQWFLRVLIDHEEKAIDLDDCSRVSEKLSKELDRLDPIPGAYILEVSSPGAERPLKKEKDYLKAIGKHVHVTTYEPVAGKKVFEGILTSYDAEKLTVDGVEIPVDKVAKARLAMVF